MEDRRCLACQKPIIPHPRERRRKVWCSQACCAWLRRHPGKQRPMQRGCPQCGTDISDRRLSVKYCSSRCGAIASGVVRAEPYPRAVCALPECDSEFQPKRSGQRCCSEKHGKLLYNRESRADGRQRPEPWNDQRRDRYHRRRAQKARTSTGEPVLLAEIAERDSWRCSLCQQSVDSNRRWPDPLSPSLDHVQPLSKGGAHDPSNVRLAHVRCNSARGNRPVGESTDIG